MILVTKCYIYKNTKLYEINKILYYEKWNNCLVKITNRISLLRLTKNKLYFNYEYLWLRESEVDMNYANYLIIERWGI